jgi:ABC-type multidrug transport system fused ATPase/permease subunit
MTDAVVHKDDQRSLLAWTLSFLRPYRAQVAVLIFLLLAQVALGALQPWPLKVVIDYVLDQHELPEPFKGWMVSLTGGNRVELLVIFVIAGVVIQVVNQLFAAFGTQVQVNVGQRMVYDLRYRLFAHLESLGLHHHITTSTGDAVYRVDVDSYALENLAMSGVFPLATSIITLLVMFFVLLDRDVTVALLSLTVVPFLFLCLRYYATTLSVREERVKELESNLISRLYESFTSIRLIKSFAREPYESVRYQTAGDTTMNARIAITWSQSLFGVAVGTITILGTGLVLVVGGMHVMRGTMTVGDMTIVIAYLGAVYGPLSAIAHTTGQLQGAVAGARRVRSVLALIPETVDRPGAADLRLRGVDHRVRGVGPIPTGPLSFTISTSARSPGR